MKEPEIQALCTQLEQLNERSRWYTNQMWQVPFAYIGIVGVTLAGMWKDVGATGLSNSLFASAVMGTLVLWHIHGVQRNTERAVNNIRSVETKLNLELTVEYNFYWTTLPVFILTVLAILCSLTVGCTIRP